MGIFTRREGHSPLLAIHSDWGGHSVQLGNTNPVDNRRGQYLWKVPLVFPTATPVALATV